MVVRESANRRDDTHLRARCLDNRLLVRQFDHGEPTRWQIQGLDWREVSFEQAVRLRFAIGVYVSSISYCLYGHWTVQASRIKEKSRQSRMDNHVPRNDPFGSLIQTRDISLLSPACDPSDLSLEKNHFALLFYF